MAGWNTSTLSAAELLDRVAPYYPRWDREVESLDDYLERYHRSPELLALRRLCAHALEHDEKWRAFTGEVRGALPDVFIQDAIPRWDTVPSYQVVIGYGHPPGSGRSKYLVFRLSHLAPVYDYYEADRDEAMALVRSHRVASPEAQRIATLVADKIVQHFGYAFLDPDVGRTPVPDIYVGTLFPGEVTLAEALFDEIPSW